MKRRLKLREVEPGLPEEDPISGIANLFDLSAVFIVSLIIALFTVFRMQDLFDETSEFTVVKTDDQGRQEIIKKKGKKIEAYKVSSKTLGGQGDRLGVAYRLEDGSIIYVPEEGR